MKIITANEHGVFTIPNADIEKEHAFLQDAEGNNCMLIADKQVGQDPTCYDCALPTTQQYTCKWWGEEIRWLCDECSQPNWLFKPVTRNP